MHKVSKQKTLLLVLTLFLGLLAASAQDQLLVLDFEDASEFSRWRPLAAEIKQNQDPRYIFEGKSSAVFINEHSSVGEARWPRVEMSIAHTPGGGDWSLYNELHFDLFNPHDFDAAFHIKFTYSDGTANTMHNHKILPGHTHKVWPLPDLMRNKKVARIMFLQSDPSAAFNVYVDNFQLQINPQIFNERLQAMENYIKFEVDTEDCAKADMLEDLLQLRQDLAALRIKPSAMLQKMRMLNQISDNFEKLKEKLYEKLCKLAVDEFELAFPQADWGYGWTHGAKKVHREQLPYQGQIAGTAQMHLARREVESVQIVLRSRKKIDEVKVQVGELKNLENGMVLPPGQIETMLVGYVKTLPAPYRVEPATWRPDPLLSFMDSFSLDAEVWQPVWIDVTAKEDTQPGTYQGHISVSGRQAAELKIPFSVTVWDFALPLRSKQQQLISFNCNAHILPYVDENVDSKNADFVAFNNWKSGKVGQLSAGAQRYRDLDLKIQEMLLRHRVNPSPIYDAHRPLRLEDAQRWLDLGGNTINLSYVTAQGIKKGELLPNWVYSRLFDFLEQIIPQLKKAGIYDYAWLYSFDEVSEASYAAAIDILAKVKEKYADLPVLTTAFDRDYGLYSGLDSYIDGWCPNIETFVRELDKVRYMQGRGKKIWFYSLTHRPGKVMSLTIEEPATAARMTVGMAQVKYKPDGFLYYAVTEGQINQKRISTGPLTEHNGRSYADFNGCGMLLYPSVAGPMPCIRLKAMRDGFEDFEYYALLEDLLVKVKSGKLALSSAELEELESLAAINPQVIKDLEDYDRSGDVLMAERAKIGAFLQKHKALLH